MWVAKGKATGKIYSKEFENIEDCQKYIDINLKKEMEEELKLRKEKYIKKHKINMKHIIGKTHLELISSFWSNSILCYNIEQGRFCDGFDF